MGYVIRAKYREKKMGLDIPDVIGNTPWWTGTDD